MKKTKLVQIVILSFNIVYFFLTWKVFWYEGSFSEIPLGKYFKILFKALDGQLDWFYEYDRAYFVLMSLTMLSFFGSVTSFSTYLLCKRLEETKDKQIVNLEKRITKLEKDKRMN
ncbi:hypothetical protein [Marispirochaeta sp.]|jgi:hypothetical protein|uniref:hypothetical protein n=1 Tax=Marispirochaeta sp. TaxID=2038653 RepID=UPI0029C8C60B|nr:hypothetical protein [Marispirochaeta sp.]